MSFDTRLKAPDKDKISLQNVVNQTKKLYSNRWELFSKKMAHPNENFEKLKDYSKSLTELKLEH